MSAASCPECGAPVGRIHAFKCKHYPDLVREKQRAAFGPTEKMRDFPTHFREDRQIMERICPHGIGHPDPDDAAFRASRGDDDTVHGCDGCCYG